MDIRRKKIIKASVRSSIDKLLDQARESFEAGKGERSTRYVRMAMELLKKHKVKLPSEVRNSFCRKCLVVWIPGKTLTVQYDRKNTCLRVRCDRCGYSKRL
jgi:ribonuclease P protein subunit RPR2